MYPQPQQFGTTMAYSPTTPNNSCSALPFTSSMMRSSSVSTVPLPGSNTTSTNIANNRNHCRSRKRPISAEDESTDEESESNTSSHKSLQMADTSLDSGCHLMSRKKRRGMIEKRRRDRINNSLHELKRLVPAAFEKQGSAKLEKAEILQLTVDHLRMLHSKGFDAFSFDPHKFATDYHLIGFRECAAEIARYLVVHEGIDFQDPLRLRLISHLQCYSAQREISLKSSTGWNPSLFTTPMYPTPASATNANSTSNSSSSSSSVAPSTSTTSASTSSSTLTTLNNVNSCETSMNVLQNSTTSSTQHSQHNSYAASASTYSHYSHHHHHQHHQHHQNPQQYEKLDNNASPSSSMQCNSGGTQQPSASNQIKSPMSPMATFTTLGYASTPINTAIGSSIPTSPSSTSVNSYSYAPYPPPGSYFAPTPTYMTAMVPPMGGVGGVANQSGGGAQSNGASNQTVNSVKHYRPWGTELAY